jgi:NADH:ubiquinone oxidoreductase subunit 5 (subunit L)/multisubunit Na+/H+ antiporter MnhA subunit
MMPALSRREPIAWAVVAATGLILAVAGLLGPEAAGTTGARLAVHLPGWVLLIAAASAALASFLLVALTMTPPRRRRRKDEEEFELYHEPPELTPLAVATLLLLALLPLGLVGSLFWLGKSQSVETAASVEVVNPAQRVRQAPPPGRPERPVASAPTLTQLYAGFALLIGLGGLGTVIWLYYEMHLRRLSAEPSSPAQDRFAAAARKSLEDLRLEPDPRAAIIKCYRRFEEALAAAECPRAPWQTPAEFMRATLARLLLPERAIRELTRLFELARFSCRPLDAADREAAWESTAEIEAALVTGRGHERPQ